MAATNAERALDQCAAPTCPHQRRAWRIWLESQRGYSLDGHWYCSPTCFQAGLVSVIEQFLSAAPQTPAKAHRVPLGLLMLSRGLVDNEQLKLALKAQKDSGSGRVGEWLRHIGAVSEDQVTQVLGMQWSIPVFPLNRSRRFLDCAQLLPFRLLEVAEMVPVHHLPNSQHLYMAFVDHINYSALYAVEKILACRTEPCLAAQSHLLRALEELRHKGRPIEVLVDHLADPWEMAASIFARVIKQNATELRVSGFDGVLWARILSPRGSTDLMFQSSKTHPELIIPDELQGDSTVA